MTTSPLTRSLVSFFLACCVASAAVAAPPAIGPIGPRPIERPDKPSLPALPGDIPMIESRLGFMIESPLLFFNNTGVLTYTAGDGMLSVMADPLALRLNMVDPPILVFPAAGSKYLSINVSVAPDGSLIGGVPGNDLEIVGEIDLDNDSIPDVSGILLAGEVTEYLGENGSGSTDFHSFRFTITSGGLVDLYGTDIGVELTSEDSNFTGDYTVDFDGEAKGNVGVVECTGTIGDFVWLDLDGDGIQDPDEDGIGGVQIILTDADGNVTTTATSSSGFYQFEGLCAGTYTVSVNPDSLPPDVAPTLINAPGSNDANDSNDPDGTDVTLPNNDSSDQDTDFGYVTLTSALGDFVWEDLDMDGIQDGNEPGVPGVMVNLYDCAGNFIDTTTTDGSGFYLFDNLGSGCYVVEFIVPGGFVFSPMDQTGDAFDSDPDPTTGFTDPVDLGPGETNLDVDAGIFQPPSAELGDRFWEDVNGNGIQDPGEPGIPGVTVNLLDCAGNLLDTTATDGTGMYLFTDLPAGCYVVEFLPPQDCILTTQDAGIDDTVDSDADPVSGLTDPIDLAEMESDLTWDAGCYFLAGLGDFVWNDLDQDGLQDIDEPGIEGLDVILLDADMIPTGLTTVTGPNGEYEFTGLPPGDYFVQFTAPPSFVFTTQDAGVDDTIDSDANGTGKSPVVNLESGEFDPTIDAGVFLPNMPAISIEKSTNGDDADNPTGPFIPNGDPVLWEYVVTNTGNVTLTGITVVDDQGVIVTCPQNTLEPNEMMTCTGNGDATVDQYENLGSTCGMDPAGSEVCDDDPSHYFGSDPSIDIEKATNGEDADTPTGPFVTPGASVTWTYVVTNTGNVTLSNVMVSDDQGVTVSCPIDELAPGQIMTCTADGTAVAGQYANIGTVVGDPPVGDPVDDEDPSHYFGALPGIDIEKATNGEDADLPTGPFVPVGGSVEWTYVVTNTGNVTLTNVTVTDSQGVAVACPDDTLDPGESFTCTGSGSASAGQYENLGTVTGTPPAGPPVDDEDPSHYFGAAPAIDIEKSTNGDDADTPTGPFITIGEDVNWTYVVTNTGNIDLFNVVVTDDQGVTVTCPADALIPGASFICTAMGIAVEGQYENLGTVTGDADAGGPVTDEDPSHYFGASPGIDIEKATNGEDADNPTGPIVAPGSTVDWTYVVTNTGNVTLTGVTVTDDQGAVVTCPADTLEPGESLTCTASGTALVGQYQNIGSVTGNPPVGPPVDDLDPSHYFGAEPAIDLEKLTNGEDADSPTGPVVGVGSTVTWTYVITNMGNVSLSAVTLNDSVLGAIACNEGPIPTLAPGDNFLCTVMGIATAGQYMNLGTTCGTDPTGAEVCDEDPSHYFGATPSIDIEKATNGEDADDPTGPLVEVGGPVTWTYVVTNTGNVLLADVTVTDDQGVTVTCPTDLLAPGDSFTCTADGIASAGQYENLGSVIGTPPVGGPVTDEDPSHYFGVIPGIDIEKLTNGVDADDPNAGDAPQIMPGDTVTWTYIVTNNGNVTLSGVSVSDDQGVTVVCPTDTLDPGASMTCTASGPAEDLLSTGFTTVPGLCGIRPNVPLYQNMGMVSGSTPAGTVVTDVDPSHYCNPEVCALEVSKTCLIPMAPATAWECTKPIDTLTMIYDGTQDVRIKAWKGEVGSTLLADIDEIQPGEEVSVMGYAGSPNDVTLEIFLANTDSKIGESVFHLSCSDDEMDGPEDCGLPQGNGKSNDSSLLDTWLLEGIVDAGGTLDCTQAPPSPGVSECEFQTFPASCETGNADFLTFQYTGGGCAASDNDQGDHVCSGSVDGAGSATFTDDDGNSVTLEPGETVTIARNLAKEMTLSNAGGTETNVLHTSCSQPLQAGDVYGGLTLVGIDGMGIGTDVVYSYTITNSSDVDIVNLMANDIPLGPIPGAPSSLAAGESVTLTASAFITETTTNTAIVDGDTADGQMCSATDTATVTILPPPPCDVDGEGVLELSSDKIKWNLTNNGAFTATVESLEISWPAANGELIEVKLDGDKIFDADVPADSTVIGPGDWINDLHKRQIPPGDTDTLEIKFAEDVVGPQTAYSITVNFEEGCSVTFENTGLPFECNKPIDELTMIWDGAGDIGLRAWKGPVGSTLLFEQASGIGPGTEVSVSGYSGSPNDVFWEILSGGSTIGESKFHLSCSDNDMNGAEDCGNRQGNGKDNDDSLVNDWILEGMVDEDGPFDCSNLP